MNLIYLLMMAYSIIGLLRSLAFIERVFFLLGSITTLTKLKVLKAVFVGGPWSGCYL